MRRLISTFTFCIALTVLAMAGDGLSQGMDGIGQQAIAGPHMPVVPMTIN